MRAAFGSNGRQTQEQQPGSCSQAPAQPAPSLSSRLPAHLPRAEADEGGVAKAFLQVAPTVRLTLNLGTVGEGGRGCARRLGRAAVGRRGQAAEAASPSLSDCSNVRMVLKLTSSRQSPARSSGTATSYCSRWVGHASRSNRPRWAPLFLLAPSLFPSLSSCPSPSPHLHIRCKCTSQFSALFCPAKYMPGCGTGRGHKVSCTREGLAQPQHTHHTVAVPLAANIGCAGIKHLNCPPTHPPPCPYIAKNDFLASHVPGTTYSRPKVA